MNCPTYYLLSCADVITFLSVAKPAWGQNLTFFCVLADSLVDMGPKWV